MPCHPNCLTCFGGAENECEVCAAGKYLEVSTNRCVSKCKENEILIGSKCEECHPDCATCSGTTADSCTSCHDTYYLIELTGKCDTDCPE